MPKKRQPASVKSGLEGVNTELIENMRALVAAADKQKSTSPKQERMAKARAVHQANVAKRKAEAAEAKVQVKEGLEASPKAESGISKLGNLFKRTKEVKPTQVLKEVPGNGHKKETLAVVANAVSPFKYQGWLPQEIPAQFRYMTPHWLWRRIHWEEQAKIARVKPSGLPPALKMGAAIVVLILGIMVIFVFGIALMDQGG